MPEISGMSRLNRDVYGKPTPLPSRPCYGCIKTLSAAVKHLGSKVRLRMKLGLGQVYTGRRLVNVRAFL